MFVHNITLEVLPSYAKVSITFVLVATSLVYALTFFSIIELICLTVLGHALACCI